MAFAAASSPDPLRIAQIAPCWLTVPPKGYGGIEAMVARLADGLVEQRGHDVTLFASGDSHTAGALETLYDEAPGIADGVWHAGCGPAQRFCGRGRRGRRQRLRGRRLRCLRGGGRPGRRHRPPGLPQGAEKRFSIDATVSGYEQVYASVG